jgi:hypothetical protein
MRRNSKVGKPLPLIYTDDTDGKDRVIARDPGKPAYCGFTRMVADQPKPGFSLRRRGDVEKFEVVETLTLIK